MIDLSKLFRDEVEHAPIEHKPAEARCYEHDSTLPCPQCAIDKARGYKVKVLAGRCANGSELDSGTRWHAVKFGTWTALCGAKPGRRSAGWSSWYVKDQTVTCPRCIKAIERKAAQRWSTDKQREEWMREGAETGKRLADEKVAQYHAYYAEHDEPQAIIDALFEDKTIEREMRQRCRADKASEPPGCEKQARRASGWPQRWTRLSTPICKRPRNRARSMTAPAKGAGCE